MARSINTLIQQINATADADEARAQLLAMNWYSNPTLRRAIAARDGWTCCYCGTALGDGGEAVSLDHVECQSHGGTHSAANLVATCQSCNSQRCNRTWQDAFGRQGGFLRRRAEARTRRDAIAALLTVLEG